MGGKVTFSIIFGVLLLGVKSQNETTTKPPSDQDIIATESGICRKCQCIDKKVDCSKQEITTYFPADEWNALKSFKPEFVDFSDNAIINVTVMAELPIKILNLSHCGIEFIQFGSFKDLQKMSVLDLSYNKLTYEKLSPHAFEGRYAPEELEPLRSMRSLNLAYNKLHSLNQDLFEHMPELTDLDLSGNPLTTIDHVTLVAISSLPLLKVLRMRSCELTEIPEKFLHTPRYLEKLDISGNKLTSVPSEIEESKNLLYLNLNQNPIKELDDDSEDYPGFPRLKKLKELHMSNMPELRKIGAGTLSRLENLNVLHMCYNPKLTYIDPKAFARPDDIGETYDYPLIQELHLQYNNLSRIDSRMLARWDLVKNLDISNNPWLCDCTTNWMVSTLVPIVDATNVNASMNLVCQEPIEMRGYNMKHLHDTHRNMRCLDKYGNRPEKDGAILLGLLIGVLLAVPIMLALVLMWRQGYFTWIGLRGPTNMPRTFYKRAPDHEEFM